MASTQPSGHSTSGKGKKSRRTDAMEEYSSQGESDEPSSPARRRIRRVSKRTVVTSDEDEQEDKPRSRGDVTTNEENEDEDSDCASTYRVMRKTRSRILRRCTSRDSIVPSDDEASITRLTKKKRSIDVRHMMGDKRVRFQCLGIS